MDSKNLFSNSSLVNSIFTSPSSPPSPTTTGGRGAGGAGEEEEDDEGAEEEEAVTCRLNRGEVRVVRRAKEENWDWG